MVFHHLSDDHVAAVVVVEEDCQLQQLELELLEFALHPNSTLALLVHSQLNQSMLLLSVLLVHQMRISCYTVVDLLVSTRVKDNIRWCGSKVTLVVVDEGCDKI